jgi:hypothetical protein
MAEETLREPQMGLTFEKVWAMFQETDRCMQEADRRMQETMDRIIEENARYRQETERILRETSRETDRKISKLGSRIGDLVEELIAPNILEKFNKLGYAFGKVAPNVRYSDSEGRYVAEVDLLLENGDTVLAVEVKTNLTNADVRDHAERMEKLRRYADEHGDRRKLVGAVAGAIAAEEAKAFAVKNGFFVLEQSGDTIKISVPEGFKPREW